MMNSATPLDDPPKVSKINGRYIKPSCSTRSCKFFSLEQRHLQVFLKYEEASVAFLLREPKQWRSKSQTCLLSGCVFLFCHCWLHKHLHDDHIHPWSDHASYTLMILIKNTRMLIGKKFPTNSSTWTLLPVYITWSVCCQYHHNDKITGILKRGPITGMILPNSRHNYL